MTSSIRIDKDVIMETRDGVNLRADIYRPYDRKKYPAILIRTPYNKARSSPSRLLMDPLTFVPAGYSVIIQDVRGRFASDGTYQFDNVLSIEGRDGYDTVEWIARQPWCDGNVAMMGVSALSGMQWATAMENPPHLKAIAPWMGGMRSLGTGMQPQFSGGVIAFTALMRGIPSMWPEIADRLEREGKDVTEMRHGIEWVLSNPAAAINFLPLKYLPVTRPDNPQWLKMSGQRLPDEELEKYRRYEKITVPCYHLCGWYDVLEVGQIESFINMRKRGGSQLAREGQYIVIGPWTHRPPDEFLGGLEFGISAGSAESQVTEQHIAFYNKYLRGMSIDLPAVRYFVMGRNRWQTADDWPLPQTQWQRYYLHSQGHANTAAGDGILSRDEPGSEPPDIFVYDPHNPVPTIGGRFFGAGIAPGPMEQSYIEKRQDVLCYSTSALKEDIEITGPLQFHLFAATSAVDTDFTARLVDVWPDGRAYNVIDGIKRARGRKSETNPEPVNPGEVYEFIIVMGNTSQLFRKGHCIRIEVSSSSFPMFDRNMNTGNRLGEDAKGISATQSIFHDTRYSSYIDIPLVPG